MFCRVFLGNAWIDNLTKKTCKNYCPCFAGYSWVMLGLITSRRDFPKSFKLYVQRLLKFENWGWEQPEDEVGNKVGEDWCT